MEPTGRGSSKVKVKKINKEAYEIDSTPCVPNRPKILGKNNAVKDEERSIEERNEKTCYYSVDEIQNMMLEIFGI